MNRIKVPSQSKQSLEKVIENLQDNFKINSDNKLSSMIAATGILMLSDGDDIKITDMIGNVVYINKGIAITPDLEFINIDNDINFNLTSAIQTSTEQLITLTQNTYYVVKLFWKLNGSDPVAVANGFNYNGLTALPEEQRWSKYSDSYTISLSSITNGSIPTCESNEIMLGIIKTATGSTSFDTTLASFNTGTEVISADNGIVDIRKFNILKYKDLVIGTNNTIETSNITPHPSGLTIKSNADSVIAIKNSSNSSIFYVDPATGKIGVNMTTDSNSKVVNINGDTAIIGDLYVNGWKVLTEAIYDIKNIPNFKIKSTSGIISTIAGLPKDQDLPASVFSNYTKNINELLVYLEWGYSQIQGTGGSNGTFTVTSGGSFTDNELQGYYLFIPGAPGTNYYIASNVGNVLTLHSTYQVLANMTGVSITAPTYAKINSNVSSYEITATPKLSNGSYDYDNVEIFNVSYDQGVVLMSKSIMLNAGVKYNIQIRGVRGDIKGPWTPLLWNSSSPLGASGSFTHLGVTYNYGPSGDVLVKHVNLTGTSATVTSVATPSGFKITLNPGAAAYNWSYADEYEFAYSDSGTSIDWANKSTYESIITNKYTVSISTYDSTSYNISVRPLIGRLAVADPISTVIFTGTGGALPANSIIATIPVNHETFSGSTYTYNSTDETITFSGNIYSPASSTKLTSFSSLKHGHIITINGLDYRLKHKISDAVWEIVGVNHSNEPTANNLSYEIGTSEGGRKIYTTTLPADTQITKLEAMCTIHAGEPVTVRVYQNNPFKKNQADHLLVDGEEASGGSGQNFSVPCDHTIVGSMGDRVMIVDLWDPAAPTGTSLNNGSFIGTIMVYGQNYTTTNYNKTITQTT